jgi:hypothetical protein
MRLYIHREGAQDPEVLEVDAASPVVQALDVADGTVAILEDADESLPVEKLVEAVLHDGAHVFLGVHKRLSVTVAYVEREIEKEFSASARVKRVFEWAVGKHGFKLSEIDAAEHILALEPGETLPPEDAHIGSLTSEVAGRLSFALVPKKRFEG